MQSNMLAMSIIFEIFLILYDFRVAYKLLCKQLESTFFTIAKLLYIYALSISFNIFMHLSIDIDIDNYTIKI